MDSLLSSLSKFTISNNVNEFEMDLMEIMDKMKNQEIDDSEEEWETIKENYTKLKFLDTLIKEHINISDIKDFNLYENESFTLVITKFMEQVDKANIRYLRSINWEEALRYVGHSYKIEELLNKSVNVSNPYEKMLCCQEAYNLFIPVIEEFRGETYEYDTVNDSEFLEQVNSLKRKRK